MALRILLLATVALRAAMGEEGGEYQDMDQAQMEEYMKGLPADQQEQMRKAMAAQEAEQQGPPPSMTLKKARLMMKTLRTALTGPKARAKFDAIDHPKTGPEAAGRTAKSGPLAEKIAQKVADKFGVGDLNGAVREAMRAGDGEGETDKQIRAAMEDIEEVIIGGPSQKRVGRTPKLDKLAGDFLDMDEDARAAALAEAKEAGEAGEVYVEIMEHIVEDDGDSYVRNHFVELVSARGKEGQDQRAAFIRMNVLREFMRPQDHKKLKENYKKSEKAGKGEEL